MNEYVKKTIAKISDTIILIKEAIKIVECDFIRLQSFVEETERIQKEKEAREAITGAVRETILKAVM